MTNYLFGMEVLCECSQGVVQLICGWIADLLGLSLLSVLGVYPPLGKWTPFVDRVAVLQLQLVMVLQQDLRCCA